MNMRLLFAVGLSFSLFGGLSAGKDKNKKLLKKIGISHFDSYGKFGPKKLPSAPKQEDRDFDLNDLGENGEDNRDIQFSSIKSKRK